MAAVVGMFFKRKSNQKGAQMEPCGTPLITWFSKRGENVFFSVCSHPIALTT